MRAALFSSCVPPPAVQNSDPLCGFTSPFHSWTVFKKASVLGSYVGPRHPPSLLFNPYLVAALPLGGEPPPTSINSTFDTNTISCMWGLVYPRDGGASDSSDTYPHTCVGKHTIFCKTPFGFFKKHPRPAQSPFLRRVLALGELELGL